MTRPSLLVALVAPRLIRLGRGGWREPDDNMERNTLVQVYKLPFSLFDEPDRCRRVAGERAVVSLGLVASLPFYVETWDSIMERPEVRIAESSWKETLEVESGRGGEETKILFQDP
ncbi:hypothetical protein B0T25DRAFT_519194 [Lasiosphaeria hispida]|uniref:Uncharacterized protein n=1 Tax=Lasiosphaeria hispida TaxID=260671 RepID=A0AAJ0HDJ3_9PEZI|nr:hypothetical protein B0T25DRAFT_519194 [Lasiosphaeria hispida]